MGIRSRGCDLVGRRIPLSADRPRAESRAACAGRALAPTSPTGPPGRREPLPTRPQAGRSRRQRSGWAMMTQRARQRFLDVTGVRTVIILRCRARPNNHSSPACHTAKPQVTRSHHNFAEALRSGRPRFIIRSRGVGGSVTAACTCSLTLRSSYRTPILMGAT